VTRQHRGFTLIEVMVAAAVLGLAATALFGLFSRSLTNLRTINDLHKYQLAGEEIMNRVLLQSTLPSDGAVEGRIDRLNARWVVSVTPWIPQNLDSRPREAVMKIDVQILWRGRSSERSVKLETVKGAVIEYSNYDFQNAIETALPN
jgi:prepilin-type N-terminal cleavage/methylation domain-containing protein